MIISEIINITVEVWRNYFFRPLYYFRIDFLIKEKKYRVSLTGGINK